MNNIIIGLTGQTGAGKTTLANHLKMRGFYVIDADMCAREVVAPKSTCLNKISDKFGGEILNPDGSLNRKKLGDIVFSDGVKLEALNSITNGYIIESIKEKIGEASKAVVIDAPTLFESGADSLCDFTVSVIASENARKSRIMKRDILSNARAQERIDSQHGDDYYISKSDYIIKNNLQTDDMLKSADEIFDSIIAQSR